MTNDGLNEKLSVKSYIVLKKVKNPCLQMFLIKGSSLDSECLIVDNCVIYHSQIFIVWADW